MSMCNDVDKSMLISNSPPNWLAVQNRSKFEFVVIVNSLAYLDNKVPKWMRDKVGNRRSIGGFILQKSEGIVKLTSALLRNLAVTLLSNVTLYLSKPFNSTSERYFPNIVP